MNKLSWLVLPLAFAIPVNTFAQEQEAATSEPKTQLEAFERQIGTVVIKGYSTVGKLSAFGTIEVDSREFLDASTGKKILGIVIHVTSTGAYPNEDSSFIDYDEIDPLLKGISYIVKVDRSSTKLANFEAVYRTKGDLSVTTFSSLSSDKIEAAVESGVIGAARAFISTSQLIEFRAMIDVAKQRLDSIK